ncbi:MAG: thiamine phosphate synthase [Eubacterium sp.]
MSIKIEKKHLRLYIVTDRSWLGSQTLQEQVKEVIDGGATCIQIREKGLEDDAFIKEAATIKVLTDAAGIPFIVNDNIDVALAIDADGVHIGQSDGAVAEAKRKLGSDKILGVSAQTLEQALSAEADGADYLGVGAVFPTSTKTDAVEVEFDTLRSICDAVQIPVVAIGGISEKTLPQLAGSNVDGVAVISAVFSQKDRRVAAKRIRALSEKMVEQHV